jgi:hypothetical protein
MKTEEEVQAKLDSIQKALAELKPDHDHFKVVYESQIYILRLVLEKKLVD